MKKYLCKGRIYCNEDLSLRIENYGGNLNDLYSLLKAYDALQEEKVYYSSRNCTKVYRDKKELLEEEFKELEVDEDDDCFKKRKDLCFERGSKVKVTWLGEYNAICKNLNVGDVGVISDCYKESKLYCIHFNKLISEHSSDTFLYGNQLELVKEQK